MGQLISIPSDAVFIKGGHPATTSLKVAEIFGKRHDRVIRAIKELDCSDEFRLPNFGETSYLDSQNRLQPMFEMTKDGFTFLVMGFTGPEAAKFKEAYIRAFNMMETTLTSRPPAIDPLQLQEMIRQAVAAALPQAASTEPRKMIMVDAADYELLQLKAEQKTVRVPFTTEEKLTMRGLKSQGIGNTEIAKRINRSVNSIDTFFRGEKEKQ